MEHTPRHRHQPATVIVPIQFLRGIAASFVVIVHLLDRLVRRGAFPHGLPEWAWSFGQIGVATFFAISGFIMVHTTAYDFGDSRAGRRFMIRRFCRVAPIYYLTSALMLVFAYATFGLSTNKAYHPPSLFQIVCSLLFVPYIGDNGLAQPVYGLGWTLDYEMFFYLVFAVAMAWSKRVGLVSIILVLAALVTVGLAMAPPPVVVGHLVPAYYFTRPVLLYFIIGMVLAMIRMRWAPLRTGLPEWVICVGLLLVLGIGVRVGAATTDLAGTLAVAVALAGATLLQGREGSAGAGFAALSRAFGDASYSMYLTHSFLLGAVAVAITGPAAKGIMSLFVLMVASCGLCAVVAWFVWRFVEVPLTRALRRSSPPPRTRPA